MSGKPMRGMILIIAFLVVLLFHNIVVFARDKRIESFFDVKTESSIARIMKGILIKDFSPDVKPIFAIIEQYPIIFRESFLMSGFGFHKVVVIWDNCSNAKSLSLYTGKLRRIGTWYFKKIHSEILPSFKSGSLSSIMYFKSNINELVNFKTTHVFNTDIKPRTIILLHYAELPVHSFQLVGSNNYIDCCGQSNNSGENRNPWNFYKKFSYFNAYGFLLIGGFLFLIGFFLTLTILVDNITRKFFIGLFLIILSIMFLHAGIVIVTGSFY